MRKKTFRYKDRDVEVVSIDSAAGGHGFGLVIDGVVINRGGYDRRLSKDEVIEHGVKYAKEYIDSLP